MPVEIADWNDLDNVRNDLTGDYVLVNDLDSETAGYAGIGDDWEGNTFRDFTGTFNGDGFEIRDLDITVIGSGFDGEGLFANIDAPDAVIENLHVDGVIEGPDRIGLLCGLVDSGTIKNCSGSGQVINTGGQSVHAFIGRNDSTVENCASHIDVTSDDDRVGGLVGWNLGTVTDSYATGSVEGDDKVGGLVGRNAGTVEDSYATGSVEGGERVGGLVGDNRGPVTESYATGSVEGDNEVGGLAGGNSDTVTQSYATGSVAGDFPVGGLVGLSLGDEIDSYWDTETTGQSSSGGDGIGLTTSEMQGSEAETNMDGFDFENVWSLVIDGENSDGDGYPILRAIDFEAQGDAQNLTITGYFDPLDPPEPPQNLTAELL